MEEEAALLPYRDRVDGGKALAKRLGAYRGKNALVLGIPRGGVPVAAEVARELEADLDVIVARKLGAPGQPELAIGAVTANGGEFLNQEILDYVGASENYIARVRKEQMEEARRREARFRGDRPPERIPGRVVIVVDDGLATGATMRAAVRSVRKHGPARLVVAVPVGAREACEALRQETDEVVCLATPEPFGAVGYFYRNFEATEDVEVENILREFGAGPGAGREAANRHTATRWS
ncbi:MAG: phosphoribosyltransferase [Acidobacteriota bacterium]